MIKLTFSEWERVPARNDFRGSHNSGDHSRTSQFGTGPNNRRNNNFSGRGPLSAVTFHN